MLQFDYNTALEGSTDLICILNVTLTEYFLSSHIFPADITAGWYFTMASHHDNLIIPSDSDVVNLETSVIQMNDFPVICN